MPNEEKNKYERCILMLCDSVQGIQGGIGGANRSLALSLSRYRGINIATTIFSSESALSDADRKEMADNNITLITPYTTYVDPRQLYRDVNQDPMSVFPDLKLLVPHATHIVGHSPITAEAALRLRETHYEHASVILLFHVIPDEVAWMGDTLAYPLTTDTEQVRIAERADVVYSVTEKIHCFYIAKFRNRAQKDIDHRLFTPQCMAEVFAIERSACRIDATVKILALSTNNSSEGRWEGLDIAALAVSKVADGSEEYKVPCPQIVVGGVTGERLQDTKAEIMAIVSNEYVTATAHVKSYHTTQDLFADLTACTLCVIPSRAEPYGYRGLFALSAGIPTLISADSALAPIIKRLTSEPEYFLVPVTRDPTAFRQDASVWRDRILDVIRDPETAFERAHQLRIALRRDEATKETLDNMICYTLGGIHLTHEASKVDVCNHKDDAKELPILRSINNLLTGLLKQCWRLKHHPLTTEADVVDIIPGLTFPIVELSRCVLEEVEAWDRRIVGVDKKTGAFIVYCPTPAALSDLWSMCDNINEQLTQVLMGDRSVNPEDEVPLLKHFGLKDVVMRTTISGPEFLKYKQALVANRRK